MYFDRGNSVPLVYTFVLIILYDCVSKSSSLGTSSEINCAPDIKNTSISDDIVNSSKKILWNLISISTDENLGGLRNEDIYLNGTQLIEKYGYKVQEHHVTTKDGYKLAMFRIPGKGRVVFLMHGLLSSFVDWLTVGPNQGLPYLLANQGYDVWMGNARGNTFSRRNKRLSPSDPKFWEFSFHEIGTRDLPAMIDYVLAKTRKKKLTYIGHSQGTTSFFVLCSTKPKYNRKINFMVALSAVAWMKHVPNPIIRFGALIHGFLHSVAKFFKFYEILPDNRAKKAITRIFCGNMFSATIICQNLMFFIVGFDFAEVNFLQSPVMFSHFPSGASLMQWEHYAQLIVSGYFRQYDYGSNLNLKIYGSVTPPSYPVHKIKVPTAIFYSQGDGFVSVYDVDVLRKKLKNVVKYEEVRLTSFNHLDYLWAKNVKNLVYDKVLHFIKHK